MFLNINNLNLGKYNDGNQVGDVVTPCGNNPYEFTIIMKNLLEGENISAGLNSWIDLIFGIKAKDKEAKEAKNLFTEQAYQEDIDLDIVDDKNSVLRYVEFGLIPNQLFNGKELEKKDKLDDVKKSTNSRIAIEFINLSGIDIDCWLDANEELIKKNQNNVLNKFKLEGVGERNQRKILTDELTLYYKQLSEAQSKMKKDKFSFRIKGYVPVYGNDFSTSYTSSFRIKKSKIAKDEIKPIYTAMKDKKKAIYSCKGRKC